MRKKWVIYDISKGHLPVQFSIFDMIWSGLFWALCHENNEGALAVILMQFVAVCRILFCENLRFFLFVSDF